MAVGPGAAAPGGVKSALPVEPAARAGNLSARRRIHAGQEGCGAARHAPAPPRGRTPTPFAQASRLTRGRRLAMMLPTRPEPPHAVVPTPPARALTDAPAAQDADAHLDYDLHPLRVHAFGHYIEPPSGGERFRVG
jgi:hypothetical protein